MKILTIVGARPQFIKAAPVSSAFAASKVTEVVVHTGQHYDTNMSDVFFDELNLVPPKWHLGIGGGTHGEMTGKMLEAIEHVLLKESPEWVLVYGDTNSTLAGGLAAAKLNIPIAHVEAGLRSFNRRMPEEINRVLVDHLSTLLFAPTDTAVKNLQNEGIESSRIHLVGDVMFDAVRLFEPLAGLRSGIMDTYGITPRGYALATIHRAENTDAVERLSVIVEQLLATAIELPVVFPLHPRTRRLLEQADLLSHIEGNLVVTPPLGYLEMILLERNAAVIATDSGGVQKEAYFHQVPCVTLRDETEWVELIETGWNRLCPPVEGAPIAQTILGAVGTRGSGEELYGDGHAANRILKSLVRPPHP